MKRRTVLLWIALVVGLWVGLRVLAGWFSWPDEGPIPPPNLPPIGGELEPTGAPEMRAPEPPPPPTSPG